jgi:hypothetical protein
MEVFLLKYFYGAIKNDLIVLWVVLRQPGSVIIQSE